MGARGKEQVAQEGSAVTPDFSSGICNPEGPGWMFYKLFKRLQIQRTPRPSTKTNLRSIYLPTQFYKRSYKKNIQPKEVNHTPARKSKKGETQHLNNKIKGIN